MTVSRIRVKLPTKFPSSVSVSSPLTLSTTGGAFAFALNVSTLEASLNPDNITSGTQTGTGALVRATSPTLVTPVLGAATATSINKVTITAPATSATLTIPDGVTLTGPAATGTAMTLGNAETVTGAKTFGSAGAVGKLKVAGTTSGSTIVDATAVASGTLTLPAATDTLMGKATTDILTNKTYDTAGTGNVFKVNGTTVSAITGTGSTAVLATTPTITTPNIVGTATNDSAATGSVGEYVESVIAAGSATSLVSNTAKTVTSISLTAGDWDVDSVVAFITAATTSVTAVIGSLSGTTNTLDLTAGKAFALNFTAVVPGASTPAFTAPVPPYRLSLSGTTTVFLIGYGLFTISTLTAYGIIRARRVR